MKTGVVKERMDLMEDQKDDMKLIGDMAKGNTPFDAAKAAAAARDIQTTSGKIPELFPEGTAGHPSEAKEEIWQDWEDFTAKADDLARVAGELSAALRRRPATLDEGLQASVRRLQGLPYRLEKESR